MMIAKFPTIMLAIVIAHHARADVAGSEPVPTAEQMRVLLARRPEMDVIRWKDEKRGGPLAVRILEVTDKGVSVQKTMPSGVVSRVISIPELSGLSFALTGTEKSLVRHPSAAAVEPLRVLWNARAGSLGMEGSNVAEIGLALAKSLRLANQSAGLDEAGPILDRIRIKDNSDQRKTAARMESQTLSMAKSLATANPEETDRLAWEITGTDDNPEAMLMAVAWLADRHFAELKRVEEEHPRWQDDDEVRPLRLRLYNLSLDFTLYPSLFLGGHAEEAAAGLKKAWEVHVFTGAPQLAMQTLEDLSALYPGTNAAKETADELARLKSREAAGRLEEASSEAKQEDDEEPSTDETTDPDTQIPPPLKRYNLFDD